MHIVRLRGRRKRMGSGDAPGFSSTHERDGDMLPRRKGKPVAVAHVANPLPMRKEIPELLREQAKDAVTLPVGDTAKYERFGCVERVHKPEIYARASATRSFSSRIRISLEEAASP